MGVLLNYDAFHGVRETIHYNKSTDDFTIKREFDISGLIELNKTRQGMDKKAFRGEEGDWWLEASIPMGLIDLWGKEGINVWDYGKDPDVTRKIRRRLNDPELRFLRAQDIKL